MAAVPGFVNEDGLPGDHLITPGAANETRRAGHSTSTNSIALFQYLHGSAGTLERTRRNDTLLRSLGNSGRQSECPPSLLGWYSVLVSRGFLRFGSWLVVERDLDPFISW